MKIYRFLIGFFGGYALSAQLSILLASLLTYANKGESVMLSLLLSFIFWTGFLLYAHRNITIKTLIIQFTLLGLCLVFINTYLPEIRG